MKKNKKTNKQTKNGRCLYELWSVYVLRSYLCSCALYVLDVLQVWGVTPLVYYAEAMAIGKPLPNPYENVHDDTEQVRLYLLS